MSLNLRVGIVGASGFIGRHLLEALGTHGHHTVAFTRQPGISIQGAAETRFFQPDRAPVLADLDAVVNLAGSTILRRWSANAKRQILESRVQPTRRIMRAIANARAAGQGPSVLINASGTGFYGDQGLDAEPVAETAPPGSGFLARTAALWENEALHAAAAIPGLRAVALRIGFVIGPDGGAVPMMRGPFQWCLGGPLGPGRQWMSWIHVDDLARLILYVIETPGIEGPVNAVAPEPVTNREFTSAFAKAVRRPAFLPVPAFLLRLLLGEMAELVLSSSRVRSEKLAGFGFVHPGVESALRAACAEAA